jgi:hypothetical protein
MYINDATRSAVAIKQGGWTLKHLNAVGDKGLNGSGVVATGDRHIHGAQAVFHDQNSSAALSVNDRSAYRGAKT